MEYWKLLTGDRVAYAPFQEAADHPDRREAQAVVVFTHEPDIIGFIGSPDQADRCNLSPLQDRVMNSLRMRDIGIDHEGDHAARPAITVRIGGGVSRLNLIEGKKAEAGCRGYPPDYTGNFGTCKCQVAHSKLRIENNITHQKDACIVLC